MATIPSTYMSLPVPVPTVEPGPQYATDLNQCLGIIDAHTHTPGSGQPIVSSAISINMDLPFNGFNATGFRSIRFTANGSPISGGSDLGCVYVSGVDLYYNDINGNQVRITNAGSVAGTPGSIGNLVAPASITYVSGSQTYVFQSSTATPGNIDVGSVIIRPVAANANGITLNAPVGLPANYQLTYPSTLPSTGLTKIMTVTGAGNLGFNYDVDQSSITIQSNLIQVKTNGITQAMHALRPTSSIVAAGGVAISNSQNTYSNGTATFTTICSCTLSTLGNPIKIQVQDDGSGNNGSIGVGNQSGTTDLVCCSFQILRNTTLVGVQYVQALTKDATVSLWPPGSISTIDTGAATSSYTYYFQGASIGAVLLGFATAQFVKLTAYEL